jgi:two-component system sensor kinase FixL
MREILTDIAGQGRRAGEVIRRMRQMLKKDEIPMEAVHLAQLAEEVIGLIFNDLAARKVSLEADFSDSPSLLPVQGDRIQLQQVILNLLVNACEAMEANPAGRRNLTVTAAAGDGKSVLRVRDEGPGLAPGILEQVFAPFYTTKPDGLGMGLAICRSIVTAHGGRLTAENHPDGGAVFRLELPPHPRSVPQIIHDPLRPG